MKLPHSSFLGGEGFWVSYTPIKQPKTTTGPVDIFPEEKNSIGVVVTEILRDKQTDRKTSSYFVLQICNHFTVSTSLLIHLSIYPSLNIYLFMIPSIQMSLNLFMTHPFSYVSLSIYLSIYASIFFTHLSINPFIKISIYPSIYLNICLSIHLSF